MASKQNLLNNIGGFVSANPTAMIVMEESGQILQANSLAEELFRGEHERLCGLSIQRLLTDAGVWPDEELLRERLQSEQSWQLDDREVVAVCQDQDTIPVQISLNSIPADDGSLILASVIELSSRRMAERASRLPPDHYASLIENLPIHVLEKDREGRLTHVNPRYCDLIGRPLDELLGLTDYDLFPPELAAKYRADDRRVMETGVPLEDVEEHQEPGSEKQYVHVFKVPLRDESGRIVGVQGMFWDVTEKRRAEDALDQERYLLHTLMQNLPDSIYFKDRESRYLRVSRGMATKFGFDTPEEIPGLSDFDIFAPEFARATRRDEERIMLTGQPMIDREEEEIWPDGRRTWCTTTKLPLYDRGGNLIGTFGISSDTTEHKRSEAALREAMEVAEAANRAKSDFLANMSHEIRTPMNAIIGMTQLVLETSLAPSQHDYLTMVAESGESLMALIDDILDCSKIEAGKLDLERISFPLRKCVSDAIRPLAMRAGNQGLELQVHLAPDIPEMVFGDPVRLRQVLINLVGNAIKFTPHGAVTLNVRTLRIDDQSCELQFEVRDTGIGIPAEKQRVIFEAFEQADMSTTREYGGTGLGLAISSKLVRLMGGQIDVDSRVARGSSFRFTICFERAPHSAIEERRRLPRSFDAMKVLVVAACPDDRRNLGEMLEEWRLQPIIATSAEEALSLLKQARGDSESFGLILADMHLPDVGGPALVESLRLDGELQQTPLLLISQSDPSAPVAGNPALSIAGVLPRPIESSELLTAIIDALGVEPIEEAPGSSPSTDLPSLRILLVEDSVPNQRLAIGMLERWGHEVHVVSDGRAAIAAIGRVDFDLVLMDIQMPVMDGLQATAEIRRREKSAGGHLPIIAMTAHAMKGDREACIEAGMDGYVTKPVRPQLLLQCMAEVIRPEQRCLGRRDSSGGKSNPPAEFQPSVDWAVALATVDGDGELLAHVLEAFVVECPQLLEQSQIAIRNQDGGTLQRAAHTLKGNARLLAANRATDLAARLEELGRSSELAEAGETFDLLHAAMETLIAEGQRFVDDQEFRERALTGTSSEDEQSAGN